MAPTSIQSIVKAAALFAALVCLGIPQQNVVASNSKPDSTLKFALADKHGFPNNFIEDEFDCSDKIYAVSELDKLSKGKHHVEFHWVDPDGNTRERTKYDFFADQNAQAKIWAWLELTPSKGAVFVRWMNPAAGMEEFIGEWKLELFIDQKRVNSGEFLVAC